MKIAQDPTPFHHDHELLELPRVVADLGYEWIQLTPHPALFPFYRPPRADDQLVKELKKACGDAGVGIASVLPVQRWSGPDEWAREAAVRSWKRIVEVTVDLGCSVIGTEFSGRPERAEESEAAFYHPPGNAARVHQHLQIGDGDVDWDDFFGGLAQIGFYDSDDTIMCNSVFAEDERASDMARFQLKTMTDRVAALSDQTKDPR